MGFGSMLIICFRSSEDRLSSVCCALAFFSLGFPGIGSERGPRLDLLWLGLYFGFGAIYMLGLALRPAQTGISESPRWKAYHRLAVQKTQIKGHQSSMGQIFRLLAAARPCFRPSKKTLWSDSSCIHLSGFTM